MVTAQVESIARWQRRAARGVAALGLALALPAAAQPASPAAPDRNVFDGDYLIVGAGAMSTPTYEGSDDSRIRPAAGATGELGGIGFTLRGPSLSLDLLKDQPGAGWGVRFGPQVRLRSNRHGKVGDPVVARLGKLGNVVEAGFRVGARVKGLVSQADRLSMGVSARWDVSGKDSGMTISPSMTYLLPVSRAQAFGMMAAVQLADRKYADYNYGITPAGAAASGLPVYRAKGGLQEASIGIATARDLNGDFLDGGFAIGAGVLYSRLFGSAAKTPITSLRGDRDQWTVGGGLAYTF